MARLTEACLTGTRKDLKLSGCLMKKRVAKTNLKYLEVDHIWHHNYEHCTSYLEPKISSRSNKKTSVLDSSHCASLSLLICWTSAVEVMFLLYRATCTGLTNKSKLVGLQISGLLGGSWSEICQRILARLDRINWTWLSWKRWDLQMGDRDRKRFGFHFFSISVSSPLDRSSHRTWEVQQETITAQPRLISLKTDDTHLPFITAQ